MAEGVLVTVAEGILTNLGSSVILNEIGLLCGVKDELKKLEGTVSRIKAVLLDAEEQYVAGHAVTEGLKQLKEAMYDAEDLVDDFSTEALRRKVMSGNKLLKEVRLFFSSSNQLVYALILAHKIKKLKGRLDHIAESRKFDLVERPLKSRVMPEDRDQTDSIPPEIVIGRDADEKAILEVLIPSNCKENVGNVEKNVGTLAIVGIGGLGKTTLAQKVYNNEKVIGHFKMRAWVCVAENFDVRLIVEKILSFVSDENLKNLSMDTLVDRLHKKISGEKYLIVLDDVWEEHVKRWDRLQNLLGRGLKGSRIIITTRLMNVAKMTKPIEVHELKCLSTNDSWSLFTKMALREGEALTGSDKIIGEEIVAKCSGVPLALNVMGRLMCSQSSIGDWSSFRDIDQAEKDIMPILSLSYDYLPSHLKHCFAYCSIFPKDHVINVSTLINLWMAQGYVRCLDSSHRLEDVGLRYFFHLVRGSFFQELEKDELGNVTTCKMHDFMHDLAVKVAGSEKSRHVSFCVDESNSSCQVQPSLHEAKDVRSFLLFHQYGCKIEEDQLYAIFSNVRRLRVLDLHQADISLLPRRISKLKYLRHIDLSENWKLKMLPDSITELQNLQVLNLEGCLGLEKLPKHIKKLVNLIQLNIYKCEGLTDMPKGLGELTSLSMLTRFVLAKDDSSLKHAGALDELGGLKNLGGLLEIYNLPHRVNVVSECRAAKLTEKQHIQRLQLDWQEGDHCSNEVENNDLALECSNEVENNELALEALQPPSNLKELSVRYYRGSQIPGWWLCSLKHLVKIVFHWCNNCRHLPPLHQLPSLVTLEIWCADALEYIEDNTFGGTAMPSIFPSLKTLSVCLCPKLKGWWKITPKTQLPRFNLLSELTIRYCPEITAMPLFPPLRRLRFDGANIKSLERILNIRAPSASSTASLSSSSSSSSSSSRCLALSQLEYFNLSDIRDLKSLPEWMQHISTLQKLIIDVCDRLETLPKWMRQLNSLQKLKIDRCSELSYRLSNNGEDWEHIDHIPNIRVNGRKVQRSNPSVSSECTSMQSKGKKIMEDAIESEEDMEDATENEEDMEDATEREEDMEDAIEREEEKIMCLGMFTCLSGWLSRIFQLKLIRKTKSERNISS